MGRREITPTAGHVGLRGPADTVDPRLARRAALLESASWGPVGIFGPWSSREPDAPTAPWGREAAGLAGLDLTGTEEGGGGRAEAIGMSEFDELGRGRAGKLGEGAGPSEGSGVSQGRPDRGHTVRAPSVRELSATVNGRLPPEVIQRIVRQNFGGFRACYERGLRGNPSLQGRVAVKFVIDRGGGVAVAADGGSDFPDRGVVQCVVSGFSQLSFPEPEGGRVTVVYPIVFDPGS
jgi:hypothetical protein